MILDYDKVLCGRMYIDGQLTYSEVGIADISATRIPDCEPA